MTTLLEQAISLQEACANAQLKTLPTTEQDAISIREVCANASLILEEIKDEAKWEASFAKSSDILAKLAAAAMAEYHAGKTQELDPETL